MTESYYTLASWYVQEGQDQEFLRVWKEELAAVFLSIAPKAQGKLIQSLEDPRQFYSFGPWESLEQMQVIRTHPQAREAITHLTSLCEKANPGGYRVVLTVP